MTFLLAAYARLHQQIERRIDVSFETQTFVAHKNTLIIVDAIDMTRFGIRSADGVVIGIAILALLLEHCLPSDRVTVHAS